MCKRIPSDNVTGSITFSVKISKDTPLPNATPTTIEVSDSHLADVCEVEDREKSDSELVGFAPKMVPLKILLND